MPMFYTPSPRKFHYTPRFYDPEKEEWNKMKEKYGIDGKSTAEETGKGAEKAMEAKTASAPVGGETETKAAPEEVDNQAKDSKMEEEIAYFERRDRELARKEKAKSAKFGWKDLVRKREMPTFNYKPRFSEDGTESAQTQIDQEMKKKKRISRRFDIEDTAYFEPISAGKIMLYALGATLLLLAIVLI